MNRELIAAFTETITAERGAAANTVAAYTRDLEDFGEFLDSGRRTFENAEKKDHTSLKKLRWVNIRKDIRQRTNT